MTMFRPGDAVAAKGFLSASHLKTFSLAVAVVLGPLYTVRADVKHDEHRADVQHELIEKLDTDKVDKDTYDRDVRNQQETLNRIQIAIEGIHHTLEERH